MKHCTSIQSPQSLAICWSMNSRQRHQVAAESRAAAAGREAARLLLGAVPPVLTGGETPEKQA